MDCTCTKPASQLALINRGADCASSGPVAGSRSTSFDRSIASESLVATPSYGDVGPNARLANTSMLALPANTSDGPINDVMLGLIETDTGHVAPCLASLILAQPTRRTTR
jgi:hypothetical protein